MTDFTKFDAAAWALDWFDRKPERIGTDLESLTDLLDLANADGRLESLKDLKALHEKDSLPIKQDEPKSQA